MDNLIPNNCSIHIVFDGKKFFKVFDNEIRLLLEKEPSLQLWESWSTESSKINEYIKRLNENL